jgi:hypothetical protein
VTDACDRFVLGDNSAWAQAVTGVAHSVLCERQFQKLLDGSLDLPPLPGLRGGGGRVTHGCVPVRRDLPWAKFGPPLPRLWDGGEKASASATGSGAGVAAGY